MLHPDELHADMSNLIDYGQKFTVGPQTFSNGSKVSMRRILSILDYASKTEDNPFNLQDDFHIMYVRKYEDGEWFWARDSVTSHNRRYVGMDIGDIYAEVVGMRW